MIYDWIFADLNTQTMERCCMENMNISRDTLYVLVRLFVWSLKSKTNNTERKEPKTEVHAVC